MGIIKRIMNSWTSSLTSEDYQLIEIYLDDPGKFLFFQMEKIDQLHALAVTRTIMFETEFMSGLDRHSLIKAALLHDIGKVRGDFGLISRIAVGMVRRIFPILRGKLAFTQPATWWEKIRYGFYVDLIHPSRGAYMAETFGIEPMVVELIRRHHDPARQDQSPELTWLQNADNKN